MASFGLLRRAVPLSLALILVGIALTASSSAETPLQAAKRLYQAGSRHYDVQEFAKALDEFKEAYETKDEPSFLFNIAQCQRALGQNEAALRSYRTYLVRAPAAPNRPDVEAHISTLEAAIAKTRADQAKAEQAQAEAAMAHQPPPATATLPSQTDANVVVETRPRKKPVYKQWWLWTTVGVVVVGVGLGVGLGLGLSHSHGQPVGPLETF